MIFSWIKSLGLSAANYLQLAAFVFVSGLLVLLKLKDRGIHSLQVQMLKEKFKTEDDKASTNIEQLRKDYENAKKNLDN